MFSSGSLIQDNYLSPLEAEEGGKVTTRDIAIICAFRAQVLLVRNILRKAGFGAIGVGSVEDYQGQEARIVIISTVLSQRIREWSSVGIEKKIEGESLRSILKWPFGRCSEIQCSYYSRPSTVCCCRKATVAMH